MHLPRRTATRDDVRLELVEVESLWRKLNPDRALRTAKSAAAESSDRTASSSSGGRGSRSAPAGASTPARAPAAVPPAAVRPGGPLGMSATYDKSRIVEAKNGRPHVKLLTVDASPIDRPPPLPPEKVDNECLAAEGGASSTGLAPGAEESMIREKSALEVVDEDPVVEGTGVPRLFATPK
ncbi:unnamed protein product, partial [Tilletia caries]